MGLIRTWSVAHEPQVRDQEPGVATYCPPPAGVSKTEDSGFIACGLPQPKQLLSLTPIRWIEDGDTRTHRCAHTHMCTHAHTRTTSQTFPDLPVSVPPLACSQGRALEPSKQRSFNLAQLSQDLWKPFMWGFAGDLFLSARVTYIF